RGVFALAPFNKGDFVAEYRGEMIDFTEAEHRREVYQNPVFMFDFTWQNKKWCIDATNENAPLGRLVNDNHMHPNCTMKKIVTEGKPNLCLFALRDIVPGEEITYDYGESIWPWRK
ncbi:probable histone-lysine N-methyltransferase set-1, partial [Sinocyclocheilus rhinocerous]|uniref:probable histone-lysine N-methyltransferase set-1 n=1 Tax=Sinocyclocheilus rhinocerous TaxID=307959 RepID=UPI0007B859D6